MIIFEVIHEDALVPTTDTIIDDILFEAGKYVYPYESITDPECNLKNSDLTKNSLQRTICKWYGLAATTLSTFKKKVEYDFIMKSECRNEIYILMACIIILYYFDIANGKSINENKLLKYIKIIISNIQDIRYTAKPFGIKYTNYKNITCKMLTSENINNIIKSFPLPNSINTSNNNLDIPIDWLNLETIIKEHDI